jgi:hypothetical protein
MKREQVEIDDEFDRGSKRGRYRHHKDDLSLRKVRSAITNGTTLPSDVDLRLPWARRLRDLISIHEQDLGGEDLITEAQRALGRRLAMCQLMTEWLEAMFVKRADDPNRDDEAKLYGETRLNQYLRYADLQRRLALDLGLVKQPELRDMTSSRQCARNTARIIEAIRAGDHG